MHEKTKKVGKEDQNYFTILTSLYTMITCIYRLFFWHQLLTFYINTKVEGIKFFFFTWKMIDYKIKGTFAVRNLPVRIGDEQARFQWEICTVYFEHQITTCPSLLSENKPITPRTTLCIWWNLTSWMLSCMRLPDLILIIGHFRY